MKCFEARHPQSGATATVIVLPNGRVMVLWKDSFAALYGSLQALQRAYGGNIELNPVQLTAARAKPLVDALMRVQDDTNAVMNALTQAIIRRNK